MKQESLNEEVVKLISVIIAVEKYGMVYLDQDNNLLRSSSDGIGSVSVDRWCVCKSALAKKSVVVNYYEIYCLVLEIEPTEYVKDLFTNMLIFSRRYKKNQAISKNLQAVAEISYKETNNLYEKLNDLYIDLEFSKY